LSLSRTSLSWGIPVPDDPGHVIYVWYDALTNYLTGVGYPDGGEQFNTFWPADVHVVGKDILRFHAVFWPAFLLSAGIPPPLGIFAHGWWTVEGQKMSKSLGNVVDPYDMVKTYGPDAFRYFLLREVPFGQDGDFSRKALVHRINSELANDFGNLLNRSLGMLGKYFSGTVPSPGQPGEEEKALRAKAEDTLHKVDEAMEELELGRALATIWELVKAGNKYVDQTAPWALAKDPARRERLGTVLYTVLEAARICVLLSTPCIPVAAQRMWEALGCEGAVEKAVLSSAGRWGGLPEGASLPRSAVVFPRIEE
ncbi:MAG: class I tRNA ligase family protein, partial [Deltaproteobacteria bacterium]|nr:class I tRNA ligase family protein [Deltaproteobacteria bacterium]